MKEDACARAGAAPSKEDARARAPRASDSIAAAGVRGGAVKVEDVKHFEEDHELVHHEKVEPVRAAVHADELARAARMRERDSRAGNLAVQEGPSHSS